MVGFNKEKTLFNYRVAGVAIHDGKVLLDRNTRNSYWVLPGGHPEMMEPMQDALSREVKEEISEDVKVVRLLWILENFYRKTKDIHELSFYFLMEVPSQSALLKSDGPFYGEEHGHGLVFQWHALDEAVLNALPLYPSYMAKALMNIPNAPQHHVFHDINSINVNREIRKPLTIS